MFQLKEIGRYPILNQNEEKILAEKVFLKKDRQAAKILVLCNLKFVLYIVNKYIGYGLPKSDLIQEGNIGLIKAIQRFNPTLGVKLITFAVYWIKAEIHEFILRNLRIVNQRRLFFLRKEDHLEIMADKDNSQNYNLNRFNIALKNLDIRSRQIMQYRWLNPITITLQQLSIMYDISQERVRQLEHNAIQMIKKSTNL